MNIDFTWQNPTPAQEAALDMAMNRKPIRGNLTEWQMAEFICMAHTSLWYTQAKSWAIHPPEKNLDTKARLIWALGCRVIVEIVDLGYDEQAGIWWNVTGWSKEQALKNILLLMDFGTMLAEYRKVSLDVVSSGFEIFLDLFCGTGWEKQYQKTLQALRDIAPCINPYCDRGEGGLPAQVNRRERKSGACCKACMNYECSHPDCITRAKINGWPRATHPWGTKIAQAHREWRKK